MSLELFVRGLYTRTAVARHLCFSWAFLYSFSHSSISPQVWSTFISLSSLTVLRLICVYEIYLLYVFIYSEHTSAAETTIRISHCSWHVLSTLKSAVSEGRNESKARSARRRTLKQQTIPSTETDTSACWHVAKMWCDGRRCGCGDWVIYDVQFIVAQNITLTTLHALHCLHQNNTNQTPAGRAETIFARPTNEHLAS